jgi:hypothetical protein
METGRYRVVLVSLSPELFAIEWFTEGVPIRNGLEMTEHELRAALKMNHGWGDAEIDQIITDARMNAAGCPILGRSVR